MTTSTTASTATDLQVAPLSGWTGALITGVDLSAPLADHEQARSVPPGQVEGGVLP